MSQAHIAAKAPMVAAVESGKTYYWCACGQSKAQPFCDGSHKGYFKHEAVAFALPPKKV